MSRPEQSPCAGCLRVAGDATNRNNLNNEVSRATGAEATLTGQLNAEIASRTQGDASTLAAAME